MKTESHLVSQPRIPDAVSKWPSHSAVIVRHAESEPETSGKRLPPPKENLSMAGRCATWMCRSLPMAKNRL